MDLTELTRILDERCASILEYKREKLSLTNPISKGARPVKRVGSVDVSEMVEIVSRRDLLKEYPSDHSRSPGFCFMSEVFLTTDANREQVQSGSIKLQNGIGELDTAATPIIREVCSIISDIIGRPTMSVRAVLDTINKNTCLLPHSDIFIFHKYSFRVHVPLTTTGRSAGANFHPVSLIPFLWRMPEIGAVYIFNNFEPHMVCTLDEGTRCHLIIDVTVADFFDGLDAEQVAAIRTRGDSTQDYSANNITHTLSNLELRNRLAQTYAKMPPVNSLEAQMEEDYVLKTRTYIQEFFKMRSV